MILVTGATGFVGEAVLQRLLVENNSKSVAVAVRKDRQPWPDRVVPHVVGDLDTTTDWSTALVGVSAVVHCAARVHVMADTAADPLTEFRRVNVRGPLNLARQAAAVAAGRRAGHHQGKHLYQGRSGADRHQGERRCRAAIR